MAAPNRRSPVMEEVEWQMVMAGATKPRFCVLRCGCVVHSYEILVGHLNSN